jgi:hypothetical protein
VNSVNDGWHCVSAIHTSKEIVMKNQMKNWKMLILKNYLACTGYSLHGTETRSMLTVSHG